MEALIAQIPDDHERLLNEAFFYVKNEMILSPEGLEPFLLCDKVEFEQLFGPKGRYRGAIENEIAKQKSLRASQILKMWALSGDFRQQKEVLKLLINEDELRKLSSSYIAPKEASENDDIINIIEFVDDE